MNADQKEILRKRRILDYAEACQNVNKACRYFGVSRSNFYLWRASFRRHGDAGLIRKSRSPRRRCRRRHVCAPIFRIRCRGDVRSPREQRQASPRYRRVLRHCRRTSPDTKHTGLAPDAGHICLWLQKAGRAPRRHEPALYARRPFFIRTSCRHDRRELLGLPISRHARRLARSRPLSP